MTSARPWATAAIGDLFEIGAGKTLNASARAGGGTLHPFLRTANVLWGQVDLSNVDRMYFTPDDLERKTLLPGDLLVCEGGDIGRAAVWNGQIPRCGFQNHLHRLRPKSESVVPTFFMYALQAGFTLHALYEGAGNKTTIPNLSRGRLAALRVPNPPKSAQQRVTAVLDLAARAASCEERAISLLEELKSATLALIFPVDTDVPGLRPLEQVVVARGGSAFPHRFQGLSSGELPFYKVSDMNSRGNEIRMGSAAHWISRSTAQDLGSKPFPSNTVIFPKVGGALLTNKKRILTRDSMIDNNLMGVRSLDEQVLSSEYLFQWLCSIDLASLANPGPLPSINARRFYELRIPLPDLRTQAVIVSQLAAIDDAIRFHRAKLTAQQELFKSLLDKLMTGAIDVDDMQTDNFEEVTA